MTNQDAVTAPEAVVLPLNSQRLAACVVRRTILLGLSAIVARPRRFGPLRVRVLPALQNGSEEDRHEEAAAYPRAGRAQVARG